MMRAVAGILRPRHIRKNKKGAKIMENRNQNKNKNQNQNSDQSIDQR